METMTTEEAAEAFARKISSRFDVVCFDLDQCAVQTHSRGRLRHRDLDAFASHVSKDLVAAVPALLRHNCSLAIVTHSDLAQHGTLKPRDTFIFGDDLVHEVLKRCPGLRQYAHAFFVVAWRPKSRGDEGKKDLGKIRHMRTCAAFYDVPIERCVLFDDDASNCSLVEVSPGHKFFAYRCDPEKGFRLSDYFHVEEENDNAPSSTSSADEDNYFEQKSDGTIDRLDRWDHKWNHEYESKPRFHLPQVNPNLAQWYGQKFTPALDVPILLPLCGKTVDLKWLVDTGHGSVVGVEGVRRGIEELRDEIYGDLRCVSNDEAIQVWTTAKNGENWFESDGNDVSVVCGDFFSMSPSTFGAKDACFGAVYDRGAIVAVPPSSRPDYVSVIDSLLMPGGQILMVTVDAGRDKGPPFPVTPGVVEELFSTLGYIVSVLDDHVGDFGENSREFVFLLTKPKT